MIKKLSYACAAILCFVLTFHFGASTAQSQSAATTTYVSGYFDSGGQLWSLSGHGWSPAAPPNGFPPVSVSSLIWFADIWAVTDTGEGWYYNNGSWQSLGFIPGGPTSLRSLSFGALKAKYR